MFLYFVPQGVAVSDSGIGYAIDIADRGGPVRERDIIGSGPSGTRGKVLAQCDEEFDIGYYPERQQWRQHGKIWVGWYPDTLPSSDELARPAMLGGKGVLLADGSRWLVPICRKPDLQNGELRYTTALPRVLEYQDGDWVYGGVERRYQSLMDTASKWADLRFRNSDDESRIDIPPNEAVSMAVGVLGYNYRVGPIEMSALQAITEANFIEVLDATIDLEGFIELLKKKELATGQQNTGVGSAA